MKGPPAPPPHSGTLNEVLVAAARHPSGITFADLREREVALSWAEVLARAERAAAGLVELGVRRGERVAIVLPTSPEFVDAFFGTLLAGGVPVPLYPPVRLGRLAEYGATTARLLSSVGAAVVLTDALIRALLGEAVALARPRLGCRTVAGLPAPAGKWTAPAARPEDLALIQFSSGATVDPKPVALTHRALVNQCAMLTAMLPRAGHDPDRGVSWLPLYHDMGLIAGPLLAAYVPGSLVLLRPEQFLARPALWLRAIGRHRATLTPAPPFALGLCTRRIADSELEGVDLSSLRLLTCGAEPISLDTVRGFGRRFARFGLDPDVICPVYGLSEAALAVTFSPPGRPARALCVDATRLAAAGEAVPGGRPIVSVGTPIPGVEVEVRGADGAAAGERRVGRIWVKSPSLLSAYFGRPESTAAAVEDGWLDTGDLGFVADGELYVTGRAKDIVIIRGANHDPQEFEEPLLAVAGVRPGCAVALGLTPDGEDSEALLVLAERDPSHPGEAAGELEARVAEAVLAATGIAPYAVVLLPPGALPRTSSGKLRRAEALRRHLAGELAAPPAASAWRLAGALLRSARGFLRAGSAPASSDRRGT